MHKRDRVLVIYRGRTFGLEGRVVGVLKKVYEDGADQIAVSLPLGRGREMLGYRSEHLLRLAPANTLP